MSISVSLPLDRDGFLRRQCPRCDAQFKWHHGPANEEAENVVHTGSYHCPLCGRPAENDQWWTHEQVAYTQRAALPALAREASQVLRHASRTSKSSWIKFEVSEPVTPAQPEALVEPDDMEIVASPCHPHEPIKIPEGTSGPLHCLICGDEFSV